ncbi:MAG TPA: ATP-binding protein [Alphaproteobacteria bacterium]|nr:ATP-binding protein [Alphaproteobacteria bacterium]
MSKGAAANAIFGATSKFQLLPVVWIPLFIVFYIALDWLSFIHPLYGVEVTPWNPPAGLTLALLLIGLGFAPVVFVADFLASVFVPAANIPLAAALGTALATTVGYTGCAAILRIWLGFDIRLNRSYDMACLIAAVLVASAFVSFGFVTTYVLVGIIPHASYWEGVLQFWIGDAIGIVTLTPLLLLGIARLGHKEAPHGNTWKRHLAEIVVQGFSIVAMLIFLFGPGAEHEPFRLFYLLFLPLIWIAMQHGLVGAAWAALGIQGGLLVALELQDQSTQTVRSFQILMLTLAITGLILGAMVRERRRTVQALHVSESQLATILKTAPDGVMTIDAQGHIESINAAIERQLRLDHQRIVGRNIADFIPAAELLSRIEGMLAAATTDAPGMELTAWRDDGSNFPIELTAGVLSIDANRHYTVVIRDITLRKTNEALMRQHQTRLARVSRLSMAGEMASALAHELNQPLTAIAAYARGCGRLLNKSTPDVRLAREGVEHVVQQAERAGAIIAQLRDFVQNGSTKRTGIEIGELIKGAINLMQPETKQNEVDIRVSLAPDLPIVLGDPTQIEQVIVNLVQNAIEAIASVKSKVRLIDIAARMSDATMVQIEVTDSGPGVPEDIASHLFDPFISSKPDSMGLGLTISRTIIEAHGGELSFSQSPGGGARFIFTLRSSGMNRGRDA